MECAVAAAVEGVWSMQLDIPGLGFTAFAGSTLPISAVSRHGVASLCVSFPAAALPPGIHTAELSVTSNVDLNTASPGASALVRAFWTE
jgi:hypothetical protein